VVPAAQRSVRGRDDARHRGWCRQRREPDPDGWKQVALTHELRTQAVRLLVPPIVVADGIVRTSLRAALLLGLREVLGGDPEHLDVVEAADPVPGIGRRWVMVLHDLVPGGTGYLGRFTDPAEVRKLLEAALRVLRDCQCQTENVAACHRCLLPHVPAASAPEVRRVTAIDLITQILAQWEPRPIETLKEIVVGSHDTPIEIRFRSLLLRWVKEQGASVTTHATPSGDSATIVFGDRAWKLTPQVKLGGVQPDFVLESSDAAVEKIAVFCDSKRYHCSADANRLADDTTKRAALRDEGYLVWAVTHQDLDAFDGVLDGGPAIAAAWIGAQQRNVAGQLAQRIATPGSGPVSALLADALTALTEFLLRPTRSAWATPAHAVALTFVHGAKALPRTAVSAIPRILAGTLPPAAALDPDGVPVVTGRSARGAPIVLERRSVHDVRVWLAVDDRDDVVGAPEQVDAWRDWLAMSNVFQFLEPGRFSAHTVTTLSGDTTAMSTPGERLAPDWQLVADVSEDAARELVLKLAAAGVPVPEPGAEFEDGEYQIDLAWPNQQVAVVFDDTDGLADRLRAGGWTVVEPDEQAVRAALTSVGGS
jgi:hypothetical protein